MTIKRKIAMNDIGDRDIESYVRTLVSEGLGQQIVDKECDAGPSDDSGANAPVLERINPNTE